ncbi:hypothetical protein Hdeb2414_s0015g00448101 [Helianthus debilis subsp. tardiflorus]
MSMQLQVFLDAKRNGKLADLWVGQALAFERMAWLRVHGVPLHLWCDKVFNLICGRFGVVAKHPHVSDEDADISMVCVGVLVGDGKRITEEIILNWQDKRYQVSISEDLGDWIPDCLDVDEDSEFFNDGDSTLGSEMQSPDLQEDPPGNRRDGEEEQSMGKGIARLHGESDPTNVHVTHDEGSMGEVPMQEDKSPLKGTSSKGAGSQNSAEHAGGVGPNCGGSERGSPKSEDIN